MGRKSKYDDYVKPYLDKITKWCKKGITEEQICKLLGIGVDSLNKYKKQYSELIDAIKKGWQNANEQVEGALFKRATGYKYIEEKVIAYKVKTKVINVSKKNNEKEIVKEYIQRIERTTKHIAADVTAMIYWLWNRTKRWNQKQDVIPKGNENDNDTINEDIKRSKAIIGKLKSR